jgi:outer membrane protein TolC
MQIQDQNRRPGRPRCISHVPHPGVTGSTYPPRPLSSAGRWAVGVLAIAACACRPGAARAAEPADAATRGYDLAQCIRAALGNSPDLGTAAADLALARARLAEAQAGRYGRGEFNEILGFVNQAHGNPQYSPDNKNALFNGLGPFTRLAVAINLPLWTFGKLDAALEAAQHGLESEQAHGEVRRAEVVLHTKQLYYGLQFSRQLALVLHDMLDTMDKAVKKTQERLDSGSSAVTEIDLLKLKAGRAKFAKGVLEVDASTELTRSALARTVGADVQTFAIADTKLRPADATIAPLEEYLSEGPAQRPESRQLATGIAAQSAKVELERADYYPSVFLSTGVQYAYAGNRQNQTNPFASDDFNYIRPVGVVGIHWNINFLTTTAKVDAARADLERLEAQRREAASGLQLEIRRAYSDVTQGRDAMTVTEEGRKAGRGLLILTVSNFDLGIGEAEELFKGLGTYTEASSDYWRAVHDYDVAVAALSKAVGRELTPLEY